MNKYVPLLSESVVSLFLNMCFQGLEKVTKDYFISKERKDLNDELQLVCENDRS